MHALARVQGALYANLAAAPRAALGTSSLPALHKFLRTKATTEKVAPGDDGTSLLATRLGRERTACMRWRPVFFAAVHAYQAPHAHGHVPILKPGPGRFAHCCGVHMHSMQAAALPPCRLPQRTLSSWSRMP